MEIVEGMVAKGELLRAQRRVRRKGEVEGSSEGEGEGGEEVVEEEPGEGVRVRKWRQTPALPLGLLST